MKILVTGGFGYIGSHAVVDLINAGYEVSIIDNLSNSKHQTLENICSITGKDSIEFHNVDLQNYRKLISAIKNTNYQCVIHFAALKSIPDSISQPINYYKNNVEGSLNLLKAMKEVSIKNIIFSSSASIYGIENISPIKENSALSASNPYANTKIYTEQIINDSVRSGDIQKAIHLRYFNPVGAHESGLIGENPLSVPSNIMPTICRVAKKDQEYLKVYGNNYDTHDGTGVRDYIHIYDLVQGHISALDKILGDRNFYGFKNVNLGTGIGYSVLQLIESFEKENNVQIPYKIMKRREGDIGCAYADPSFAEEFMSWKSIKNLNEMCRDAWRWANQNKLSG